MISITLQFLKYSVISLIIKLNKHFLQIFTPIINQIREIKAKGSMFSMRSMYIYDPFDVRNISELNSFYSFLIVLIYENLPLIPPIPHKPPDLPIPKIQN